MADGPGMFGLIGCGQLGGAIGRRLIESGTIAASDMRICNRSGPVAAFAAYPGIGWVRDPQAIAEGCDTILLALPPASARGLRFSAPGRLVLSVMAGITVAELRQISGSARVARGMSNPAAETGMAYSPWYAPGLDAAGKGLARTVFSACGVTDEVPAESQIDVFTAITGPVPGFVAYFAAAMQDYAEGQGIAPETARRAVAQLFRAAGPMLAAPERPPAAFVREMADYAGTTAAGLAALEARGVRAAIAEGLEAARLRCLTIGKAE
ncbi:pyrroline-5-carboxylate reductase family protein [Ancylobacter terrae]|uniref:pyrroline-5-carboxylate reductase family protein n=1 Tax=Ancylobacter sp. sgz301288 TaxID=3342077 RepID=UPI0038586CAA